MSRPTADSLLRRLNRRLGGAPDSMRLSQQRVEEMKPLIERANRAVFSIFILILLLAALITPAIVHLLKLLEPAPAEPIFDVRTRIIWVGAFIWIFFMLVCFGTWFEDGFIRRRLGPDAADYERYMVTKSNWTRGRSRVATTVSCLLFLSFSGLFTFFGGERIDRNGIAFSDGIWGRFHQPYTAVSSIETYTLIDAPLGIRHCPSLRVRFADGSAFDYEDRRSPGCDVRSVASYISARSGVPITTGTIRP